MLSQKTRYGLKAMIYLAKKYPDHEYVIASELSKEDYIPKKFLEKILLHLKHQKFLESKMGRSGGYRLRNPPEEIYLRDLLTSLGEHLEPFPCLESPVACWDCEHRNTCEIRILLSRVYESIFSMFGTISLSHFIQNENADLEQIIYRLV